MKLKFDHVIHYVDDAHETMKTLNTAENLNVKYGGRHEKRGTYNTLLYFGLSYIEYLSIDNNKIFNEYGATNVTYSPFSTISKFGFKEGLYRIALRTKNLESLAKLLKSKGLLVNGPIELSRKQPDGKVLEWRLLFVDDPNTSLPLPFFIDWIQTDEDRFSELKKSGFISNNNDCKISYFGIAVHDLKRAVSDWSKWFDLVVGEIEVDKDLNAKVQRLHLTGGDILFAEPIGKGIVNDIIKSDGDRAFMISFTETEGSKSNKLINGGLYQF